MLGVPLEDENIFTCWAVTILQQGFHDIQGSADAVMEVIGYFKDKLDERERAPQAERPDDLITILVAARHDGDPPYHPPRIGSRFLLLLPGIQTTWSSLDPLLHHLPSHPPNHHPPPPHPHT